MTQHHPALTEIVQIGPTFEGDSLSGIGIAHQAFFLGKKKKDVV